MKILAYSHVVFVGFEVLMMSAVLMMTDTNSWVSFFSK